MDRTKVLITVMTYPHPSKGYQELVCTAGITESGEWVRLYPVEPHGHGNDNRRESRRPNLDSIAVLGDVLPTSNKWAERRSIIDALPHSTLNELKQRYDEDRTSLGVVRPHRVLDLEVRPADPEWKSEWQTLFQQMTLFGPPQKPLRKLPYSFHYIFECDDSDRPHTAMCEDWELGVLFLNEAARLGSDEKAAESVKNKFLRELCGPSRDTRFYMGTRFPYNTWLVLGVFWPPKILQQSLF